MRHSAVTFANWLKNDVAKNFDLVFCSDMTNLAEFRGLLPAELPRLPAVLYFHENQLSYPTLSEDRRDDHFAFTNLISALSADEVWFNSQFHLDNLLDGLANFLQRMPDFRELDSIDRLRSKSAVFPPGVDVPPRRSHDRTGPLHILWAARWAYDKNPAEFFGAMFDLEQAGVDYQLSVLGESFGEAPKIFEKAQEKLSHRILHWGYAASRDDYLRCLHSADIVVSTAIHEFFGIAIVEAIAAGAIPILPRRLSYPEILAPLPDAVKSICLYEENELAKAICALAAHYDSRVWRSDCLSSLEPRRATVQVVVAGACDGRPVDSTGRQKGT